MLNNAAQKRSAAQKRADRKYDMGRPAPIPIRLSKAELVLLDEMRGEQSRAGFIRSKVFGYEGEEGQ